MRKKQINSLPSEPWKLETMWGWPIWQNYCSCGNDDGGDDHVDVVIVVDDPDVDVDDDDDDVECFTSRKLSVIHSARSVVLVLSLEHYDERLTFCTRSQCDAERWAIEIEAIKLRAFELAGVVRLRFTITIGHFACTITIYDYDCTFCAYDRAIGKNTIRLTKRLDLPPK